MQIVEDYDFFMPILTGLKESMKCITWLMCEASIRRLLGLRRNEPPDGTNYELKLTLCLHHHTIAVSRRAAAFVQILLRLSPL